MGIQRNMISLKVKSLPLLLATLTLFVINPLTGAKRDQPHIVSFILDDMYPEMCNCLPGGKGKNLTPNIDRLPGIFGDLKTD